jgi:hypothetical protein
LRAVPRRNGRRRGGCTVRTAVRPGSRLRTGTSVVPPPAGISPHPPADAPTPAGMLPRVRESGASGRPTETRRTWRSTTARGPAGAGSPRASGSPSTRWTSAVTASPEAAPETRIFSPARPAGRPTSLSHMMTTPGLPVQGAGGPRGREPRRQDARSAGGAN